VKVGDLVRFYCKATNSSVLLGVLLNIDLADHLGHPTTYGYRVRWLNHTTSQRDWYQLAELRPVNPQ